ncbi:Uncharacterised protein [Klebsiella pneumoniae]|nr:Uncharacterised protein [Klebsiella pneumoniae]
MPLTIASGVRSSRNSAAFLPPSSRVTRLPDALADCWTFSPVATEPVKLTLAQAGCVISRWAISPPAPLTTLITPSGIPTAFASSATRSSVSGVYSLGLRTMVQPQTRAAASFQMAIMMEKFHGTMPTTTPSGWRRVKAVYFSPAIDGSETSSVSPVTFPAQPAK